MQSSEDGCCGSKKRSKGCCKEKTVIYKIQDKHQSTAKVIVPNTSAKQMFTVFAVTNFALQKPVVDLFTLPESNAPPFDDPDPAYLLNRNFRI